MIREMSLGAETTVGSKLRWTRFRSRWTTTASASETRAPSSSRSMIRRRSWEIFDRSASQRAVRQNPALPDYHHAVAQGLYVVHVVCSEDYGNAALAVEALDEVTEGQLRYGVEPDGGLV